MDLSIRPASLKDVKAIQGLNQQLCLKEKKGFDPTIDADYPVQKEGEAYFKDRITGRDGCALVAVLDGKVVGYLVGGIVQAEPYRVPLKIAEAENLLVLEGHRGSGIGKRLTDGFISWCKRQKVDRVRAIASAQNQDGIRFYEREGFEPYSLTFEKKIAKTR